jgi:hypothetical protein
MYIARSLLVDIAHWTHLESGVFQADKTCRELIEVYQEYKPEIRDIQGASYTQVYQQHSLALLNHST